MRHPDLVTLFLSLSVTLTVGVIQYDTATSNKLINTSVASVNEAAGQVICLQKLFTHILSTVCVPDMAAENRKTNVITSSDVA